MELSQRIGIHVEQINTLKELLAVAEEKAVESKDELSTKIAAQFEERVANAKSDLTICIASWTRNDLSSVN